MTIQTISRGWKAAAAAAVISAAIAAPAALAQRHEGPGDGRGYGHGEGHGRDRMLFRALHNLDLSQEQRDQIRGILESSKPRFQELRAGLRNDRQALEAASESENVDRAAVGDAFLKMKAGREVMKGERQKVRSQIEAVLTAEQRAELEGYLEGFRERGHWQRGQQRGPRGQ